MYVGKFMVVEKTRRWKAMDYALCSKLPFYLSRLRYPRIKPGNVHNEIYIVPLFCKSQNEM